jgi:hypothetical protein
MTEHNVGFAGGKRLKHSPGEVRQVVERMYDDGKVLAVILENEDGIGVQVFGEPSQVILDTLLTAVEAYRAALKQSQQ